MPTSSLQKVCLNFLLFQQPASHEDTPFTYIDSLEGLQKLRDDLKGVTEFAIDLEVSIMFNFPSPVASGY